MMMILIIDSPDKEEANFSTTSFLEKRLQKTSSDLKKISIRLSLRSPQARFLLLKSCDMQVWQFLSSLVPPPVIRPFLVRFDDAIDTTIDEHVLGVPAAKERC